jgi:hypothetical protein
MQLYALGVPQGHFTHIFLDEAGHAEEPLMLSTIAGLISADNRCVDRELREGDMYERSATNGLPAFHPVSALYFVQEVFFLRACKLKLILIITPSHLIHLGLTFWP